MKSVLHARCTAHSPCPIQTRLVLSLCLTRPCMCCMAQAIKILSAVVAWKRGVDRIAWTPRYARCAAARTLRVWNRLLRRAIFILRKIKKQKTKKKSVLVHQRWIPSVVSHVCGIDEGAQPSFLTSSKRQFFRPFTNRGLWQIFCPSNSKECPCGHLMPKITGLTHDCSCMPSHMSPCWHFNDLLPPRFLLLSLPFFPHPHTAQKSMATVGRSSSTSKTLTSMKKDNETDSFLPGGAAAICLLNLSLSAGALPTAWPLPLSRRDQTVLRNLVLLKRQFFRPCTDRCFRAIFAKLRLDSAERLRVLSRSSPPHGRPP